jgi:hypothetical protein
VTGVQTCALPICLDARDLPNKLEIHQSHILRAGCSPAEHWSLGTGPAPYEM